jgi:signal transduction histidine kinase
MKRMVNVLHGIEDRLRPWLHAILQAVQMRLVTLLQWLRHLTGRRVWGLVTVLLCLSAFNGLFFASNIQTVMDREGWVRHTLTVQGRIDDLTIAITQAVATQRAYLLTGDTTYLPPNATSVQMIPADITQVRQLTSDNVDQQRALAALQPLITAKLAEVQQTIALRQAGNASGALQVVVQNEALHLTQRIQQGLRSMRGTENILLRQRDAAAQSALAEAITAFVVGLLVLIGFFIAAGRLTQIYLRQRERLAAERLTQLEEEQRLRQTAQDALSQRDQLFGIAAHELKNPLTALTTTAQMAQRLLAREPVQNPRLAALLASQTQQARRMSSLVEGMLDTSRIVNGVFTLDKKPVNIAELVQEVLNEVQPTTTIHTLQFAKPREPLWVQGDAARLGQILHNLLQNAIRYSPDGGTIVISLTTQEDAVILAVRDQGIGIPAEALPHIFDLAYRATNVRRYSVQGMGVGLYVTQQIAQLHGGDVRVRSTEGEGSEFCVTLPCLIPAPVANLPMSPTTHALPS